MNMDIQDLLEKELRRLQEVAGIGHELSVNWLPDQGQYSKEGRHIRGQVKDRNISIYDSDMSEAQETLKHEFLESLIDKAIQPYRDMINLFLTQVDSEFYLKRETVIRALIKIIG